LTGLGAGFRLGFRVAALRTGLADLAGRRAADERFAFGRAARAGLRLDELRAFTARRNFAMPGA
jgi:hypothetical protein